jgi:hypothetical protein
MGQYQFFYESLKTSLALRGTCMGNVNGVLVTKVRYYFLILSFRIN